MTKLRQLTGRELIAVLKRYGFDFDRQSGSHVISINAAGKRVTVPVHSGRTLGKRLLRAILNDAGLSKEDLEA